jgi:predicted ArsR family transcriptional regulator
VIEGIFGNRTAEKVLLHIYHYHEIHAAAIASDYRIAESQVRRQLDRFETAGILVSKQVGRTRLYSLNQKSPFASPIRKIVEIAYESLPLAERVHLFSARRRPRRKGKIII